MAAPQPRIFYVITVRGDVGPLDRAELRAQTIAGTLQKDDRVRNAFGRPLGTVASVLADGSFGRTTSHGLAPVEPVRVRRPPPPRPIAPLIIGVAIALLCLGLLIIYLGMGRTTAPTPVAPPTPTPSVTTTPPPAPVPAPKPIPPATVVTAAGTSGNLPPGWAALNLGNARPTGTAGHDGGVWTLRGGGGDVANGSDECLWVHRAISGDFVATVRVVSMDDTQEWDKAGLMLRPDLDPAQAAAAVTLTHDGRVESLRRDRPRSIMASTIVPSLRFPAWVRLSRRNQGIRTAYSQDGQAWTEFGTGDKGPLQLDGEIRLGLMVCSHDTNVTNRAVFDNLTIVSPP